ncbi:MAG: PPE family protein, partial [Mycobacteriaceae bacterium]|nr:PPE family protein [Mycobacteriaceae bacterium]
MDFGALPPETNSALIYLGQGPTPMLAAATAWNGVADELNTMASSYASVISRLSSEYWLGPASLSMAAAAQPFMAWLSYIAECSALAAAQAMACAAAFETALAMMVPPAEVAANRAQLAALIAADGLGQNGPAIAATEARYSEMWAQDASTMYSYAVSSAIACRLTPLTAPLTIASPAGTAASDSALRASLSRLIANGPDAVMNLASPSMLAAPATGPDVLNLISVVDHAEIPMYDVFHHMRAVEADWT